MSALDDRGTWLLDVEIDGRTYRWATVGIVVDGDEYAPGLGDLEVDEGAESLDLVVLDPSVDWPVLAPELDGKHVEVRRVVGRKVQDFLSGEALLLTYADRFTAVTFRAQRQVGSESRGFQVLDARAFVSDETFPVTGARDQDSQGMFYPVIFGLPGYSELLTSKITGGAAAIVPVPIGQIATGTSEPWIVVCEDGRQRITSCVLYNDTTLFAATENVVRRQDKLGRQVLMADFLLSAAPVPSTTTPLGSGHRIYAGFTPAGGGGPRPASEVIPYLLERWGGESVDWARMAEVLDPLAPFLVDTYIDQPLADPWVWIEDALLPVLPFEVRTGPRGRYLVLRRYVSDPRRNVGTLVEGENCTVASAISLSGDGPYNEFVANYAPGRTGLALITTLLTGREGPITAHAFYGGAEVTTYRSGRCSASVARYGPRQAPPLDVWWTWDEGTAIRVLEVAAEISALPARLVEYRVEDGADLHEGDELTLVDPDRGFDSVPAIVDAPPAVSSAATTVQLRVPA